MDDLVTWLREQTADLRQAALTALRGYPFPTPEPSKHDTHHWHSHWDALYQAPGRDDYVGGRQIADFPQSPYAAAFAARFDPAAALAQCDAHDRLVDYYVQMCGLWKEVSDDEKERDYRIMTQQLGDARFILRQLAVAYQHRPGYREEWRPQ